MSAVCGLVLMVVTVTVYAETVTMMAFGTEMTIGRGPSPGPEGATGYRLTFQTAINAGLVGTGITLDMVGRNSEGVRSSTFDTDWEGLEGPSFRVHGLASSMGSILAPYSGLDFLLITDIILWDAFFGATPTALVTDVTTMLRAVNDVSPGTHIVLGTSSGDLLRSPSYLTYNNLLATAVGGMSWVTLVDLNVFPSGSFLTQLLLNQSALNRIGELMAQATLPLIHSAPVPVPSAVWLLGSAVFAFTMIRRRTKV
jgi:hypothetical protein